MSADFTAYAVGFCQASVCTSLPESDAAARLNADHPTGIDRPWVKSPERFRTGEPNPCPCSDRPETHRHILFHC